MGRLTTIKKQKVSELLGNALLQTNNMFIIGSEAIYEKETPNTQGTGDSLFLYYNLMANEANIPQENRPTSEHDWHMLFKEEKLTKEHCEYISNNFDEEYIQYISKDLIRFLEKGILFNIIQSVFTTAIDDTLEYVLEKICLRNKKQLVVYNFKDPKQLQEYDKREGDEQISLIYLFGKIGDVEQSLGYKEIPYVYTEDDAMITIADYLRSITDNNKDLYKKIFYDNRIMAIGCRFDDWKFRFFWYSIRGDLSKLSEGTVAYSCDDPNSDPLYNYLHKINGLHLSNDSRKFMHEMANVMEDNEFFKQISSQRRRGSIFISYASEDLKQAARIFEKLTQNFHFDVWIDYYGLEPLDKYEKEIEKAIQECSVFVPILSTQTKNDLMAKNNRYYMKEWKIAYSYGQTIAPITIGEYKVNDDECYHKIFRDIVGLVDANDITIKSINELDEFAKAINNVLHK